MVLSIDEKSQIQALDRTQSGLPFKRGRGAAMTCDYKRNGTTTLLAALNVLEGTVTGRNMQRHGHQDFIRFLNAIERDIRSAQSSMPSWIVMRKSKSSSRAFARRRLPTGHQKAAAGARATRAGPSTSRSYPFGGRMPPKAPSSSTPVGA